MENKKSFLPKKKQRRQTITIAIKKKIIDCYEKGMRAADISRKYKYPYTTVSNIIYRRADLLGIKNNVPPTSTIIRATNRDCIRTKMEDMLVSWCQTQSKVGPLDHKVIKIKAKQIFEKLKEESQNDAEKKLEFEASSGWYSRFRKRCEERYALMNTSTDLENSSWFSTKIRMSIKEDGYCDQTVFNLREIFLFWKRLPKIRYTDDPDYNDTVSLILGGNAAGDCKLKPVVVYHSENPKALKNKSKAGLPVIWKTNRKCTVTAPLFEDWFGHHFIPEVEKFCHSQNIPFKVLLILEISSSHPPATLVDFDPRVRVIYIDQDIVQFQPMHQGIFTAFKAIYIKQLLEIMIHSKIGEDKDLEKAWKSLDMLDAVRAIGESWFEVSKATLNVAWTKLCPFFTERPTAICEQLDETVNDIVSLAKKINVEFDDGEVIDFLHNHEVKLPMEVDEEESTEVESVEDEPEELMTAEKLAEGLNYIERGLKDLEQVDTNEERVIAARQGVQKAIAFYVELMQKKSNEAGGTSFDADKPSTSSQ